MRLFEFLAAYFRTGGGRVVERPEPAERVDLAALFMPPPQRFRSGDRVETIDTGSRATVTGPAPRGPLGEPAVNLDWDRDAGGPAYEHDLRPVDPPTGSAKVAGADELDEHYADARAVVDAGRAAVDRYDADRAGAPTDVRGVPLPPPIAPAPASEHPDRSS
jgi:hypothetical protein